MSIFDYTASAPISASSGNVAAATATATLTSAAGSMVYITGFAVTGAGATAASIVTVTVTGVKGGTQTYNLVIPAGATTSITPLIVNFPFPLAASAYGTNIVVSVPSFGTGNTNAAVVAFGIIQ